MLKEFYPYEYKDSVFDIDFQALYDKGYRGLIFDIDNTLVPHGANSTDKVDELFEKLNAMGFRSLMLSNNSEKRIQRFLKNIDALYIHEAGKPDPRACYRAVKMLGMPKNKVVVIGDQVFTDMLCANRAGLACILVKFVGHETETKLGKRRRVEQGIMWT
ncbi:MAG: YqeG family HAD IIIA-type phosphatase, partial [Lachnospiraceae bacterium]|nr:YqeG family HAD IIIA-type phosphatase [Lachnospiraceae bacterium]